MSTPRLALALLALGTAGAAVLPAKSSGAPTLPAAAAPASVTATEWEIDATHTSVLFKVKHLGASWFYGRFNGIKGTIALDEKDLGASSVLMVIQADSVDSKNEKLDTHLKSPDFFDAKQFPEIVFESKSVKKGKEKDSFEVEGDLTIRGVTKPLKVTVEKVGEGAGFGGTPLIGFHTRFSIDRTEFGVSYGADNGALGKDVELTISVEAAKK